MPTRKKLNPNEMSKSKLMEIKGIGDVKATIIQKFIAQGGVFNTIDEFQAIANLQTKDLELARDNLIFDIGNVQPFVPMTPVIPGIPAFETKELVFSIQVEGLAGGDRAYEGYRLLVEHKKSYSKRQESEYFIPATGLVRVRIEYATFGYVEKEMRLVLLAPDGSIVYDSSFQVEQDEKITIRLTAYDDQEMVVNLDKKAGVNYDGHKLRVTSTINKGQAGIDTDSASYDIANIDTLNVDFTPFGEVEKVRLEVLSSYGITIYDKEYDWQEINETDGIRQLGIDLPAPNAISYQVQIINDLAESLNPFLDHLAVIVYDLKDNETGEVVRQVEKNYSINSEGQAEVDISHYGQIDTMTLKIKAPSGEIIGQRQIILKNLDSNKVEVKVPARKLATLKGIEKLPERPKKVSGRVIDIKGDRNFEGVQVVIYATRIKDADDKDYDPLLVITTEQQGYFMTDIPQGYFEDAFAKIGIPSKGNFEGEVFDVPVRLEDDVVIEIPERHLGDGEEVELPEPVATNRLFFPANLILVVDSDGIDEECPKKKECKVDFHQKKKVVDEFSYFTVVRTTEPNIQGYTLEDDGDMTVQEIVDIVPMATDASSSDTNIPLSYRSKAINKNILLKHINDKKGLTFTTLQKAFNESNAKKLREAIKPQRQIRAVGRHLLDLDHAIDWDEDPTIYQATTLAHGHLLHFKQEWTNDGYSLGDLLYSLPLAPGQKKQIVVFDWERREAAGRSEALEYNEGLSNSLIRDRDINEIVTGALSENSRGGSTARTSSASAGLGIGAVFSSVGGLLGVSGGSSRASSSAWQNSSRNSAINDLQTLRDRTVQSASAVRSQRGTVIQTASQGERFSAQTESVANYNHCHSMTIQYFEVLRHLKAEQRLSSVQECLFIPLIMSPFDFQKILRWREDLSRYVRNFRLRQGFAAIERIENDYEGSDMPEGTYAQENIESLEGHLYIRFDIPSPVDLEKLEAEDEIIDHLSRYTFFFPGISRYYSEFYQAERQKRADLFQKYVAPEIAAALIEHLEFDAIIRNSSYGSENPEPLPLDTTLVSSFHNGRSHYVTLRQTDSLPGLTRESVKSIRIRKAATIIIGTEESLRELLPINSRVIVESGELRYRATYNSDALFRKSSIQDDLIGYGSNRGDNEFVRIDTPLNRSELRNPRNEDLERANSLQDHLNDNLEFYHKGIWMNMSPERRFMFLDGIQVTDYSDKDYKLGVVRSVASVVENKVIGIVGNSLVMPVAPGFRLDPNSKGEDVDLHALYKPTTPIEPIHLSIPTKGVFAEAVMGSCNSCEEIEENRFWKWEDHPIPDSPTGFSPVSTDSRLSAPLDTTPTPLSSPVVNIQNAPAAPDPSGMATAANLLGTSSFNNITGLEGNQKNAIEALKASYQTTSEFGNKAAEMATLGANLQAIKEARANNMIDDEAQASATKETIAAYNKKMAGSSVDSALQDMKGIQDAINSNAIPREQGNKLLDAVADRLKSGQGPIGQEEFNRLVNGASYSGAAFTYETDGSGHKISVGEVKNQEQAHQNSEDAEAMSSLLGEIGTVLKRFMPQPDGAAGTVEDENNDNGDLDVPGESDTEEPA